MILLKSIIFYYYLFFCLYSSEFVNNDRGSEGGVSIISKREISKEPNSDNCFKVINEPNKCSYVKEYCTEFQEGPINYLEIYYCTFERVPAIGLITLIGISVMFFLCIGIVASDFFCPNLDTISALLNLSESVAGVTFLAFGNGSPDLFSTFSALKAGSGALAIGELVGAAWFITSVVVGSMAIIKSFNVIGPLLLRDLWFFTGAILVLLFIIWDGKITLVESLGLCLYYGLYVTTVLVGNWFNRQGEIKLQQFLHLNSLYGDRRGGRLDDYVDTSEDGWDTEADGLLLGNLEYAQNNTGGETTRLLSTMMPSVNNNVMDSRMPPVTPITYYKRMNFWTAHEIEDALKTLEPFDPPSLKHSRTMDSIGHLLHHQQVFRSKSYSPNRMVHSTGTISPVISLTSADPIEQEEVVVKPVHVNRFKRDNSPSPLVIPQKDQPNPNNNQQPQHQYRSSETLDIPAIGGSSNTLLLPDIDTSNLTASPVSDTSSDKFSLPADPTLTILLFPGTADWKNQSLYEKFMNIITLPLYLVFTLTVPVMVQTVEEELKSEISSIPGLSEFPIFVTPASPSMQGSLFVASPISITHNKYIAERQLKIVQAFFVTIFFFEVMLVQTGLVSRSLWWAPMLVGLALSYSLHLLYKKYPMVNQKVLTALIGFFQSITWISIIATSVVDILSSLGLILQISEEVIGLTVFAFGNSLGDFISNVAVARMGYPMMAISACFAGPMLNMMLGIGLSGAILIPSQGDHIRLTVSNTTLLSGFGVLATLLAFNIYLPLNKYRIGKKFGFSLIIFYCTTMLALILFTFLKSEA